MSETTPAVRELPTYNELVSGDIDKKNSQTGVNMLLNMDPPSGWLKDHPMAKGVKYIPIERLNIC